MRVEVAGQTWIWVTDIDYTYSHILSDLTLFNRSPLFGQLVRPLMGNDDKVKLFAPTEEVTPHVKAVRKIYLTAFQSSQLKKAIPKLSHVAQKMLDVIESRRTKGAIDFQKLSVQFSLDVIGSLAMDTNLGGLDGSRQLQKKMIEAGYVSRAHLSKPFHSLYTKLFPNSAIAQKEARILGDLTAEWDVLTKEILKKDGPPEGETPMWYALKTLMDPETNARLPYKSLRGELAGLILGGMDTTGHQLGWLLSMIASHPHIADKLLEEFRQHGLYGENARELTFQDLGELKYLSAVIKEGFRIAHIGSTSVFRVLAKDANILGYRIPKGVSVFMAGNRSLKSKSVWGDPEVIRPERWMTDEDMSNKCFRIFSAGPRDCAGQRLAMLELRFAIAKLIMKYKLSMDISFDELLENTVDGIVIEAKDGIWLKATPREVSESFCA